MFRPFRNDQQTHGQLLRAELSESMEHLRQAAGYAAGGVRATAGPRLASVRQRVRDAAAKRMPTRTEEKVTSRRWPKLAGLLGLGALVGAVGAVILRRRRQQQWEEYEPIEAVRAEQQESAAESTEPKEATEPATTTE